jgi:hypothetical protein
MSNKKEELKAKVLEAQSKNDIAALYVLEAQAQEIFDEETLHGFYANILDLALENLTNTLESHQKFNMEDVQGFSTARALYEYAMEHYHAGATKDAAALFEVLSGMTTDDKFSWSLKLHWHAADQGMKLDDFIENMADMQTTQTNGTFYISGFSKKAQELLDNAQETKRK